MKTANKQIHIIGGGTVFHIRSHLGLIATAYGHTARTLGHILRWNFKPKMDIKLHLTKPALGMLTPELDKDLFEREGITPNELLETNEDISKLVDKLIADPLTKIIFFNAVVLKATRKMSFRALRILLTIFSPASNWRLTFGFSSRLLSLASYFPLVVGIWPSET